MNSLWDIVRRLRQIKYVEYQLLENKTKEFQITDRDIREKFRKKLESFREQPAEYVAYYKKNFDEYLTNKPLENELNKECDKAFNQLHEDNKPGKHVYRLIKIQ
jgi:hypothetical protein